MILLHWMEHETAIWQVMPFCTHHTTELVDKKVTYWLVTDLNYQEESEFLIHSRSKEDCVHNPGDSLEHILVFP